ncbi:peroxisomal leader peptide-processing protease [Pseudophryne corroboree]|uniref:peroxisomal leader peptide-processing protease n=1 Tax=Pseudophryne corroboree TaxID=495146 RepID=UPI0030816364
MIKQQLVHAEFSGCVVTTSRAQLTPPGQRRANAYTAESGNRPISQTSPKDECDGQWSCSGVIVDRNLGVVICQGSIFFPFLKKTGNGLAASDHPILSADDFHPDLSIRVECPLEPKINTKIGTGICNEVLGHRPELENVPVSTPQSERMQVQAQLLMVLPCPEFQNAFSRLFRKENGWVFSSEEEKTEYGEFQKDLAYLHWFAVLHLQSPLTKTPHTMAIMDSTRLVKGSTVFACGSPFGSFYPDIFLNTISKGVLSNTAGDRNAVLLTDARCLPGSEGGGIYLFEQGVLHLVGIIVAPLCWKTNEWVGLTLACSISHIIENIIKVPHKAGVAVKSKLENLQLGNNVLANLQRGPGPAEHLMKAAVLVDSGQAWGSGALLNRKVVLTCRHVVRDLSKVLVKIQRPRVASGQHHTYKRFQTVTGRVVFSTSESSPYDIAVVELDEDLPGVFEPVLASGYSAGEDVLIVGFGAFGESCGPSVTSGVLSAVISVGNVPVMLQTSCAVHGGSSGGPLFSARSGELLGIVASNTRDNTTGATYPHLNFSIPMTVLQTAIQRYRQSGELRSFGELNKAGHKVQNVWRLQRSPEKVFRSKL